MIAPQVRRLIAERGRDGDESHPVRRCAAVPKVVELIAAGAGRRPSFAYVPTSVGGGRQAGSHRRGVGPARAGHDHRDARDRHSTSGVSGDRARRELGWDPRGPRQGMTEMCWGDPNGRRLEASQPSTGGSLLHASWSLRRVARTACGSHSTVPTTIRPRPAKRSWYGSTLQAVTSSPSSRSAARR